MPVTLNNNAGLDAGLAKKLDDLVQSGKLTAADRKNFEASLAQLDDPMMRQVLISTILASGAQPASPGTAASSVAADGYNSGPASGLGQANTGMAEASPYPPRNAAEYDPFGDEPRRLSLSDPLAQRLRNDRDQYEDRAGRLRDDHPDDDRFDPRDRSRYSVSQAGYDRDSSADRRREGRYDKPRRFDDRGNNDRDEYGPDAWQQSLDETIALLERQTVEVPRSDAEVNEHALLRMLYLIAGRKEDALRPIQGIPAISQDFWIAEVYGLADMLDHEEFPTASRRAAAALERFRDASARLGEIASLNVKHAAFCSEVKSYGVIKRFAQDVFQPQETVLLYAEIENFRSTPGPEGYRTELRGSYIIQNEARQRVAEEVLSPIVDVCENERHDFFLNYFVTLPQQIFPGKYKLILTIEDVQAQRFGTKTVEFEIGKPGVRD